MATTIGIKAQTADGTPNTYEVKTHVYIDWLESGNSVRKIQLVIGEPVADYDLEFSIDDGANWNLIADGLSPASTPYEWTVTEVQRDIMFDAGAVKSVQMIVRVVEGVTELASDEVTLSMLSVVNVTPGEGIVLYQHDGFLINWDELYPSDTELFDFEIKSTGGSVWATMYTDVSKNNKSLPWNAYWYVSSEGYLTLGSDTEFHIRVTGKGEHTSNYQTFPAFSIVNTTPSEAACAGDELFNAEANREEGGRRKAVEKAELLDEAVPLGQFEAGAGIQILMRDHAGKLSDGDDPDYRKAYQLVFKVDAETTGIPLPGNEYIVRTTFGTYASPYVTDQTDVTPSPNPYWGSKLYKKVVTHGLALANKANLIVSIDPIKNISTPDDDQPAESSHCWWEPIDVNSIAVYCILKDPTVFNVMGYSDFPTDCYKFKITVKELRNII